MILWANVFLVPMEEPHWLALRVVGAAVALTYVSRHTIPALLLTRRNDSIYVVMNEQYTVSRNGCTFHFNERTERPLKR